MALPATDSFTTGTDATLQVYSANWTVTAGTFNVSESTDNVWLETYGNALAYWNADSFNDNQYSKVTVTTNTTDAICAGPAVRCHASAVTCYAVVLGGLYYMFPDDASGMVDKIQIVKFVNGARSWIGTLGGRASPATGTVVELRATGTSTVTLAVYYGGVYQFEETDSSSPIASGSAGMAGFANSVPPRLDDWEGGDVASSFLAAWARNSNIMVQT